MKCFASLRRHLQVPLFAIVGMVGCQTGPASPDTDSGTLVDPCSDCVRVGGCVSGLRCTVEGAACVANGGPCGPNPDVQCNCVGGRFVCPVVDCWPPCSAIPDPDTDAPTFRLRSWSIVSNDGFNLDGFNNTSPPAGLGRRVGGCGALDRVGGIDAALADVAAALGDELDLASALRNLAPAEAPDAGPEAPTRIELMVERLAARASDACVGVALMIQRADGTTVRIQTEGALSNNLLTATFDDPIPLAIPMAGALPATNCDGGACQPAELALTLRRARLHMPLDPTHRVALQPAMLGGVLFVGDADPAFAALAPESITTSIETMATHAGLAPASAAALVAAFEADRDLHLEPSGVLAACIGPSIDATNRNAISVALGFTAAVE